MKKILLFLSLCLVSTAFADPSVKRLKEIQKKAENLTRETMFNSIEVSYDLDQPSPAGAMSLGNGKYKFLINKSIFDTLTLSAQTFISFHELGHIYLGHTDMDPALKNRYEIELEADAFASFLYNKFGEQDKDFEDFLLLIEGMDKTTPPGPVRVQLIKKLLI